MKLIALIIVAFLSIMLSAEADARKPLQGLVICIDPGHPSETSAGTASRDGKLSERHVNWIEAVRLRALITGEGAKVVMTKTHETELVTNRKRAEIANGAHAALLLRLHCDAGPQSGICTFYPDRQGTRFGVTGPTREIIERSHEAAHLFQPAAAKVLRGSLPNLGVKGESATFIGGKQGALTASIFARVPALTVEMCVLTNNHDYAFIRSAQGQNAMSRALLAGVEAFAQRYAQHNHDVHGVAVGSDTRDYLAQSRYGSG